jgi:hypothetical protein
LATVATIRQRRVPVERRQAIREALAYCCEPAHLRRTICVAAVVGVVLTLINQSGPIFSGHAGAGTWVRTGLNFVVPFVVSNVGLLSGRHRTR